MIKAKYDSLKSYFPFAKTSSLDVPMKQMKDFYDLWKLNEVKVQNLLSLLATNPEIVKSEWYQVLLQLTKGMKWIQLIIDENSVSLMKVKLSTEVSPASLGNPVLDWRVRFSFRPDPNYTSLTPIPPTICMVGSSQVSFRYNSIDIIQQLAQNSGLTFATKANTKTPSVTGASVDSPFVLLRLIDKYYLNQNGGLIYLQTSEPLLKENKMAGTVKFNITLQVPFEYMRLPSNMPELT